MKDILFSTWAGDVVDNREDSQMQLGGQDMTAWPENLNENEPIKAFMGWDGFVLHSDDVHIVDLCRAYMEAVRDQSCGKCIPCQSGTTVMAKVLANICYGYSKLVSQDAWHNAKGIGSIRSPCSEKTSKTWFDFAVFG